MDIIQFRHDAKLLGSLPHMRQPETQRAWDTWLKSLYGLPFDDDDGHDLQLYRACTGRDAPRPGGHPEAALITGRQSGKTRVAADIIVYEAATAPNDGSADGEYALLIAQDSRGAVRALFKYVTDAFSRVEMLAKMVSGRNADTLSLTNGVTIAAYPCRPQAVRGLRARVVVVDELAHFRTSDGNPVDQLMLQACRPTTAMTGGKLIALSSPYAQTGALWEMHRANFGRDSSTLIFTAAAPTLNPLLPEDYLARMKASDPTAYAVEVGGEFYAGLSTLIDPLALEACTAEWREQPPREGVQYFCGADVSGGQRDATCAAISWRDGDQVVVSAVRAWPAPHNPEVVMGELVAFAKSYSCHRITADRYGAQFPQRIAERYGAALVPSELDRSSLYLELAPRILSGTVLVPNEPATLRELRGLERKRGRHTSKDIVDHRSGAFDDRANALAMAAYLAGGRRGAVAGTIPVSGF